MSSDYASQNPENPHDHTRFFSKSHHDHKGYSEEKCVLCGWVMGNKPLNCNNDTPHVFPSQEKAFDKLMDSMELAWGLIANAQYWDRSDLNKYAEWEAAKIKWRDEHWHPALNNELKSLKPRKE